MHNAQDFLVNRERMKAETDSSDNSAKLPKNIE